MFNTKVTIYITKTGKYSDKILLNFTGCILYNKLQHAGWCKVYVSICWHR